MKIIAQGTLRKMKSRLEQPVSYRVPLGDDEVLLNPLLKKKLRLEHTGNIHCVHCNRKINKSFNQGYCYPCFQKLAQCDSCIIHPEKCHFDQGTCREPSWGERYCLQDHIVYLANSSGLKIGITRATQVPTRWIDQGAIKALKIAKTPNRYLAGAIEVKLKDFVSDRTSWQKMLKNDVDQSIDLYSYREQLKDNLSFELREYILDEEKELSLQYPIDQYPEKIKSINFDKVKEFEGVLTGIKGQYIYIDNQYVVNMRKYSGYFFNIIIE